MKKFNEYKNDLDTLIKAGKDLLLAMQYECYPEEVKKNLGENAGEIIKTLPFFKNEYQSWYSETKAFVKQIIPDRLSDLVRLYEKPKPRKDIDFENYRIEDYLQGLVVKSSTKVEPVVDTKAAIPHFKQQLAILKSAAKRFESRLFDIQLLVQADLMDSEIDSAKVLLKNGFIKASGAVVGVVLEKHLSQVCDNHNIKFRKKNLSISDFNDALKNNHIIDTPTWRFIQHLGDIRNLCDHKKELDPTKDQVNDLISGVLKTTKTLF